MVSKNDNRHSCDKPICMYKIHIVDGLQPTTGKDDVKLYLTDAVTNWTGEVNTYDNEARRMRNTIKYCQQVTLDIVDKYVTPKGGHSHRETSESWIYYFDTHKRWTQRTSQMGLRTIHLPQGGERRVDRVHRS